MAPKEVCELRGDVTSISAGVKHFTAVKSNKLYAWGSNYFGQCGFFPSLSGGFSINGQEDDDLDVPRLLEAGIDNVWEDSSIYSEINSGDYVNVGIADGMAISWFDFLIEGGQEYLEKGMNSMRVKFIGSMDSIMSVK
jgi:hypothetical protein